MRNIQLDAAELPARQWGQKLDEMIREATSGDVRPRQTKPTALPDPDLDSAIQEMSEELSQLSLEITNALKEMAGKFSREFALLNEVCQAVVLKTKVLDRIRKLDVVSTSLAGLVHEYQSRKDSLESEQTSQRALWEEEKLGRTREHEEFLELLEKQRREKKEILEAEQAAERARWEEQKQRREQVDREEQEALRQSRLWEEEKRRREQVDREEQEALQQSRIREAEEYEARVAAERQQAQQEFESRMKALDAQLAERQRVLEAEWQAREETFRRRGEAWLGLRSEVDAFLLRLCALPAESGSEGSSSQIESRIHTDHLPAMSAAASESAVTAAAPFRILSIDYGAPAAEAAQAGDVGERLRK